MYKPILTINSKNFDNVEDLILYWQRHLDRVKDEERMLNLLLDDLHDIELQYIDGHVIVYDSGFNAVE